MKSLGFSISGAFGALSERSGTHISHIAPLQIRFGGILAPFWYLLGPPQVRFRQVLKCSSTYRRIYPHKYLPEVPITSPGAFQTCRIIQIRTTSSYNTVLHRARSYQIMQARTKIVSHRAKYWVSNEESYKVMKNRAESYCILQSHRELYKIVQNRITSCCIVQFAPKLSCYTMQFNSLNMKRASRSHAKTGSKSEHSVR